MNILKEENFKLDGGAFKEKDENIEGTISYLIEKKFTEFKTEQHQQHAQLSKEMAEIKKTIQKMNNNSNRSRKESF